MSLDDIAYGFLHRADGTLVKVTAFYNMNETPLFNDFPIIDADSYPETIDELKQINEGAGCIF